MTPKRADRVRSLLATCKAAYGPGEHDLGSIQTVNDYAIPRNQRKYVHMYLAKSMGCWRHVRKALAGVDDGPVLSVGAGPGLCLLGWFFDRAPTRHEVLGMDVLDWAGVHATPEFVRMRDDILGPLSTLDFRGSRFFPATPAPQLAHSTGLRPIAPSQLPEGATVLLPWVLNHLLGASSPHPNPGEVGAWLRAVRQRARRVILVDMPYRPPGRSDSTDGFWTALTTMLGMAAPTANTCPVFSFNPEAAEFAGCYGDGDGDRRSGVKYPQFCQATGLIGDTSGWRYLE